MASLSVGQNALVKVVTEERPIRRLSSYILPLQISSERKSLSATKVGIDVFKITKNGKLQQRRIAISGDNRSILVTSNRIKSFRTLIKFVNPQSHEVSSRRIDLSIIERIQRGQYSNRFLLARELEQKGDAYHNTTIADSTSSSLSIVYRIPTTESPSFSDALSASSSQKIKYTPRFDTLDIIVPNEQDYDLLLTVFEDILKLFQQHKITYDRSALFLQYHWIDLGKDFNDTLTPNEWITLCDKINAPIKKTHLHSLYRQFAAEQNAQDEQLTLHQTADLLLEVREIAMEAANIDQSNEPLSRVWNKIHTTDPVPFQLGEASRNTNVYRELNPQEQSISAVAFLSFIRSEQKEYSTSLEQAQNLIHMLNRQKLLGNHTTDHHLTDRLPKSRFISYLKSDINDILDPQKCSVGADDMTRPLAHYWINSSHDTYLAKLPDSFLPRDGPIQNHKTVDLQSYTNALNRGVRCLDIDTWDDLNGEPVVARFKPIQHDAPNTIRFVEVLCVIRAFLRTKPDSYPIILCIENHCTPSVQDVMASDLVEVLDSKGILYGPSQDILSNNFMALPSPQKLRGKVVIKNKRPNPIKMGATVLNDDFDAENDLDTLKSDGQHLLQMTEKDQRDQNDDERNLLGKVVRFEATGPIRSTSANTIGRSPTTLLRVATEEAESALYESRKAEKRAHDLEDEADAAMRHAQQLADATQLDMLEVKQRALEESKMLGEDSEGLEIDLAQYTKSLDASDKPIDSRTDESGEEGLEVQDFFGESVEGAKSSFCDADEKALGAYSDEQSAFAMLNRAELELREAGDNLEASYRDEQRLIEESKKAAIEARTKREYADTAERRVATVKELLRNSKDSAVSAGTVVGTAITEAKISEQRATETEARASRAQSLAHKERTKADSETKLEEQLELEASAAHERCVELTKEVRLTRERMEKAATMLDRVNEQIKLIERTTQFRQEIKNERQNLANSDDISTSSSPRHSNNILLKHASKLEERVMCTKLIKEATTENVAVEQKRRHAQIEFEEKAHAWKRQAEKASTLRKQADRSSQIAEELVEHAEEEREAASLRHIAREKAEKSVRDSDFTRTSIQAQLAEASRASEEASREAIASRRRSERLAQEVIDAKDHSGAIQRVNDAQINLDKARQLLQIAVDRKKKADAVAAEAKRLLDTSAEVYSNAKRDAAAEIHEANTKRQMERNAVQAYSKALICKRQAEQAKVLAKISREEVTNKAAAERHAQDYKNKMDKVAEASIDLSLLTCLHCTKFKYWEKSQELPQSHMHSIPQGKFAELVQSNAAHRREMINFTKSHLCRTFPSWGSVKRKDVLNYDPVVQHASGCQIVSMNLHSSDERLLLNDGRFRANGSSGYVLKPDHLTREGHHKEKGARWRIAILSGEYLPKGENSIGRKASPVGGGMNQTTPLVRVSLYDGKPDPHIKHRIHKTKGAKRNGLNPVWDEPTDVFDVPTSSPSIAMLLFSVWDYETQDFVAGAALPMNCLREGYRSIALFDSQHTRSGPYAFASLFVKVQKIV